MLELAPIFWILGDSSPGLGAAGTTGPFDQVSEVSDRESTAQIQWRTDAIMRNAQQ